MFAATQNTSNNRGGNGQYRPLKRAKKQAKEAPEFSYLTVADSRMRFNNSQDPIHFAFEYIENRSVAELAGEFVKDTFFEIANLVSKVVK